MTAKLFFLKQILTENTGNGVKLPVLCKWNEDIPRYRGTLQDITDAGNEIELTLLKRAKKYKIKCPVEKVQFLEGMHPENSLGGVECIYVDMIFRAPGEIGYDGLV